VSDRPPIWIGHAALYVRDVERSAAFWAATGMREIHRDTNVAIFEMRGGTHLVLAHGTPTTTEAAFDLMVEDLPATHAQWSAAGVNVSSIKHGNIHDSFILSDPDGYQVTVSNSHVEGDV
jgi:catechol 2,3-dioxygenase-like lactoylglutathione lyase family enzyme